MSLDRFLAVLLLTGGTLAAGWWLTRAGSETAAILALAFALLVMVFIRTELGLYILLLSMLLSPEFILGGVREVAERRQIVVRVEDLVLLVVSFTWLAKTAVNKELGLVLKTPLNRPILGYVFAHALATLWGVLLGNVSFTSGLFYVLKYVEYFFVYFIVVNNLRDLPQVRRLVAVAFLTYAVVCVVAIGQIPTGNRVSAPFEGRAGEPNTLGGYLLLMMAIAAGLALAARGWRTRAGMVALLGLGFIPFIYTQSRASYLAFIPAYLALTALSRHRGVLVSVLLVGVVLGAFFTPEVVSNRILRTFREEPRSAVVRIGGVGFDPSTSQRLMSFQTALEGWMKRPILGYGVTGFRFMDAQYPRTLVETGVVGFLAFLWLIGALLREGFNSLRALPDPYGKGLALGLLAGLVALLVHAIGANTFIIVRIMEPFWFFAAVVVMLPRLVTAEVTVPRGAVGIPRRLSPASSPTGA